MAPDLNSLPASRSGSGSTSPAHIRASQTAEPSRSPHPLSSSPSSPFTPSTNAPAASMNSGLANEESRRSSTSSFRIRHERRRSSLLANLNLNDSSRASLEDMRQRSGSSPRSPMATADPHHQRAPSLGELHQELEAEQEAQVNRLLRMIRQQQAQIQTMQAQQIGNPNAATAVDDSTPTSEHSMSIPPMTHQPNLPRPRSPLSRSSHDFPRPSLSRQSSHRSRESSRTHSPGRRPQSSTSRSRRHDNNVDEWSPSRGPQGTVRDENSFYQAETQMLSRENQMLKMRIRELERQLAEAGGGTSSTAQSTSEARDVGVLGGERSDDA